MSTSADALSELVAAGPFTMVDEASMQRFGKVLVEALPEKSLVTLSGELGAGKSVLARAMIHALGYVGRVKSPTYTLIETYEGVKPDRSASHIAHLDLYRLSDPEELEYLGFDDVLSINDLVIIEWPEQGEGVVPNATVHVSIEYAEADARTVVLK